MSEVHFSEEFDVLDEGAAVLVVGFVVDGQLGLRNVEVFLELCQRVYF